MTRESMSVAESTLYIYGDANSVVVVFSLFPYLFLCLMALWISRIYGPDRLFEAACSCLSVLSAAGGVRDALALPL